MGVYGMNGLYRGTLQLLTTTYGRVDWDHKDITDVWFDPSGLNDLLDFWQGEAFVKREQDRISAHINTGNGRLFLHRIDTDPWAVPRSDSAIASLRMLDKFAALLGVRAMHYSPQARGLSIIDFARADHPEWFERELPPNWDNADSAVSPNFTRRLDSYKDIGMCLHKWDMRAAWLESARTTPMGFGAWRRLPHFDPRSAAIWPVTVRRGIPHPAPIIASGWYSTEIVRASLDAGQDITIGPGQGWNGQTTALRPFCERLIKARSRAAGEAPESHPEWLSWFMGAIKAIYTRTFGSLAAYRQSRPKLYQPHWYYALRAESARRVWKHYHASPYMIGAEVDALYAVAPPRVSPWEIVPRSSPDAFGPGTVRYEGWTPLTRELYDLLGGKAGPVRDYLESRNCLEPWGGEDVSA